MGYSFWIQHLDCAAVGHDPEKSCCYEDDRPGSITYNLSPMFTDVLNGVYLGKFAGAPCVEAAGPLASAAERLRSEPDKYRAMNPENGWGTYEGAVKYLETFAQVCAEHPEAKIGAWL